jgi:triosephosphate isomerase (TIM)
VTGPARRPLVAGNWKMHKTQAEARRYVGALLPRVGAFLDAVEVAICAPFTALEAVVDCVRSARVHVCAQNMHEESEGAFTGEVSAPMLRELGVQGVVLGHSERREHFCERDAALARKVPAALGAGMIPILCVGESAQERDAGATEAKLRGQIEHDLAEVAGEQLRRVVIAYEPIWAIGTGRVATPEQAQQAIAFIRGVLGERDRDAAAATRILYGGSVKPDNARELLQLADVDGALVGGASLDAGTFAEIVAAAVR